MRAPAPTAALVATTTEAVVARAATSSTKAARAVARERARPQAGAVVRERARRSADPVVRERVQSSTAVAAQKGSRPVVQLDVQKRVGAWTPRRADIAAWASEALGRRAANAELSVRLVGRAEGRKLNAQYRGKDYATNVLSFPASAWVAAAAQAAASESVTHLGDLVICPPVLRAEALEQRKTLRAHWAHLVVHGSLHLIGYDHERDADARRMERREIAVLRRLGFTNPYLSA